MLDDQSKTKEAVHYRSATWQFLTILYGIYSYTVNIKLWGSRQVTHRVRHLCAVFRVMDILSCSAADNTISRIE